MSDGTDEDDKARAALLEKIRTAEEAIAAADGQLDQVLRGVVVVPRAEKTIVTEVVGDAFAKLKAARTSLAALEASLMSGRTGDLGRGPR